MEDLHGISVGDEVFLPASFYNVPIIGRVVRVTKTLAICDFGDGEKQFRLSDGGVPGQTGYGRTFIRRPSESDRNEVLRYKCVRLAEEVAACLKQRRSEIASECLNAIHEWLRLTLMSVATNSSESDARDE